MSGLPLLVLSTSVITEFGSYEYTPISVAEAISELGYPPNFESAVGHEGTARLLSELLGVEIPARRISVVQKPGQRALVFKVRERLAPGAELTMDDLARVDYELGLLLRRT